MPRKAGRAARKKPRSAAGRQDGSYKVPVLAEPRGGPVPKWTGKVAAAVSKPRPDEQLALPIAAAADDDADRVQRSYEAALAGLLAAWPMLAAPLVDDLTVEAGRSDTAGLASLAASAVTVDAIAAALSTAMAALAADAADQVAASAQAQGVDVPPVQPDQGRLAEIATVTAALIASGYATAAARRAMLAPAGTVADVVRTALTDMTVAQKGMVADHLSAALSTAQHEGRRVVFASRPPRQIRASEVNDTAECLPCKDIDGRVYRTLDEALADYPAGGYRACAGGARCRGMLVATW